MFRPRYVSTVLCISLWTGCSSPPHAPPPPRATPARAPAHAEARAIESPPPKASSTAEEVKPDPLPAPQDPTGFPPPNYKPLFERTAAAGDGEWGVLGAGEPAVMYKSLVHPHPIKGFVFVAIVAVDLRRAELHLVAGTEEPQSKTVPEERRPGLIPAEHQADLLGVFNGGFMARHGAYGVMIAGEPFVPPRKDACTIALLRDGVVRVEPWAELEASKVGMRAFRQTPECLIHRGALHPDLDSEHAAKKWGSMQNGDRETRRSAIGLDASGQILFYGLGEWTIAKDLAVAMKAAGCVVAAELDINWSYTRFLLFGRPSPGEPLQVVSTLVPKTEHTRLGYVSKASQKDFFYLKRRRP